jgi:hypothetical protein
MNKIAITPLGAGPGTVKASNRFDSMPCFKLAAAQIHQAVRINLVLATWNAYASIGLLCAYLLTDGAQL